MKARCGTGSTARAGRAAGIAGLLVMACLALSCSGGGSDGGGGAQAQTFVVGPEGGTVQVTDPLSSAFGAGVYFPPGALREEQRISISAPAPPADLPGVYRTGGACIDFQPDGITFDQPVLLYLPCADSNHDGIIDGRAVPENEVGVLTYDSANRSWSELSLYGLDGDENLAMVESGHFSTYLVYVDPADARTLDSGATDIGPDFDPGECYLGDDSICHYSHLTLLRRETGLTAIVDRNLTYVQSGNIAQISEDGSSAVFDAASAFSKVLASGDATQWDWECEFVSEYTYLKDYEVGQDNALTSSEEDEADAGGDGDAIYCQIEAVDASMVRITWQINVFEQVIYQTTTQGSGHCLAVRFRAVHR